MKYTHAARSFLCIAVAAMLFPTHATGADWPKQGTTNYVIHYVVRPINTIDAKDLGKAAALELVGTTANLDGGKLMDKMIAHCVAVRVDSGQTKYMDGGCTMTDGDGDKVFTIFDTRELDGALPRFGCGTHTITGGSGKYKGMTGKEPFSCNILPSTESGQWAGIDIEHRMTYKFE